MEIDSEKLFQILDVLKTSNASIGSDVRTLGVKVQHIEEKLLARQDKLESQQEMQGLKISGMKDDIHELDKRLEKLSSVPEDVGRIRHSLKNVDQRVVAIEYKEEADRENAQKFQKEITDQLKALADQQKRNNDNWTAVNVLKSRPLIGIYALAAYELVRRIGVI